MASGKSTSTKKNARAADMASAADPYLANLQKFDHLVILMMENRSFDQMLGYLSLEAGRIDVDGLRGGEQNAYRVNGAGPVTTVPSRHAASTALGKNQDPCHDGVCVDQQVASGNTGFVQNYSDRLPKDPDPGLVMDYFNAGDLPVYDFLAREFSVADRWFSSVLGSTWPNRLYLTSGMAAGSRDNKTSLQYRNKSWVRYLDANGISWKGYGDGFNGHSSIRYTDQNYRSSDNFEPFSGSLTGFGFVRDCETGKLPAVSLIDPAFFKNDDHPPADIANGQTFVARAYNALARSPAWDRTLLVLLYDEHGGFFDHVTPGPAADDDPDFRHYGVRVPAFFIGPYVPRGQCFHSTWDHTSLIKTILQRFCAKDGTIPDMGARVAAASHVGEVLSGTVARAATPFSTPTVKAIAKMHTALALSEFATDKVVHEPSDEELAFIKAARGLHARNAARTVSKSVTKPRSAGMAVK